jgi:hypothetical protein
MTLLNFVLSAICIGLANTCVEWFFIGFLFHKSQALTPQTWRPESSKSYLYSTLLSFVFGALFTVFYWKVGSRYAVSPGLWAHIKLGLICFGAFSLVSAINSAIYVNYARKFTIGILLSSAVSYVAAAIIAGLFYR